MESGMDDSVLLPPTTNADGLIIISGTQDDEIMRTPDDNVQTLTLTAAVECNQTDDSPTMENTQEFRDHGGTPPADAVSSGHHVQYDFCKEPIMMTHATSEFTDYIKGCKWSPDGSCLLVGTSDWRVKLFALPEEFYSGDFDKPLAEMTSYLSVKEGGTIYDYCWYPSMNGLQAETCCLITTAQDAPIHLWDSVTGQLRCTYKPINSLDEIAPAYSLAFSRDGCFIYAGFNKHIRVFDASRGGRQIKDIPTHKKRSAGQTGIVSCFDFHPSENVFAAGSYSRSVAVYDGRSGNQSMILEGHAGGVTQVKFNTDGNLLISGARKDNEILAWDMRQPGQICYILQRNIQTNQRIQFDLDPNGRYVASGNHNGMVNVWELSSQQDAPIDEEIQTLNAFKAHNDCINGCSFHPSLAMLATASGQRSMKHEEYSSDEDESEPDVENCVKLWWLGL